MMYHYSKEQLEERLADLKEVVYQREVIPQRAIDEAMRYLDQVNAVIGRRKTNREVLKHFNYEVATADDNHTKRIRND